MNDAYTRRALDIFLDAAENDNTIIWREIEDTPENASPKVWKETIQRIAMEFSCTPRFALLRILAERIKTTDPKKYDETDNDKGYTFSFTISNGKRDVTFTDISYKSVENMTKEDLSNLKDVLLFIASQQKDYTEYKSECRDIINNALQITKDYRRSLLSRQSAISLGHMLRFSLNEIQWFMLRVLENSENFDLLNSYDLIDVYGFLTNASLKDVYRLKNEYKDRISGNLENNFDNLTQHEDDDADSGISKRREMAKIKAFAQQVSFSVKEIAREDNFTKSIKDSYKSLVESWAELPETKEEALLGWLENHKDMLDSPSRESSDFYRMLAVYCYAHPPIDEPVNDEEHTDSTRTTLSGGIIRNSPEYVEDLLSSLCKMNNSESSFWYMNMRKMLYQDGELSKDACLSLANTIYKINMSGIRYDADREKNYITLNVPSYGNPYPYGLRDPNSVNRISSLLLGITPVEKRDVVSLLFLIFNCSWRSFPITDEEDLCNSIFNFEDACRDMLKKMCLPDLYLPHPMEQAMFLSIVDCILCENDEDDDGLSEEAKSSHTGVPADSYMKIMLSLKKTRNRS